MYSDVGLRVSGISGRIGNVNFYSGQTIELKRAVGKCFAVYHRIAYCESMPSWNPFENNKKTSVILGWIFTCPKQLDFSSILADDATNSGNSVRKLPFSVRYLLRGTWHHPPSSFQTIPAQSHPPQGFTGWVRSTWDPVSPVLFRRWLLPIHIQLIDLSYHLVLPLFQGTLVRTADVFPQERWKD